MNEMLDLESDFALGKKKEAEENDDEKRGKLRWAVGTAGSHVRLIEAHVCC